ncbi:MAG: FeoA family protein [Lachnospirales bacterium]
MTLAQIKPGHGGVIATVEGEGALRRHLLDMGLTPGTKVMVRKVAPMGDPMELFLRGYALSLRKDEAAQITMREESLI